MIHITLVYSPAAHHPWVVLPLQLPEGASVQVALDKSQLSKAYPEILQATCGIFSTPVTPETRLQAGDRLEIYRPLLCDPKQARRLRVKKTIDN